MGVYCAAHLGTLAYFKDVKFYAVALFGMGDCGRFSELGDHRIKWSLRVLVRTFIEPFQNLLRAILRLFFVGQMA